MTPNHVCCCVAGNLVGTLFQKEASKRFLRESQEAQRRDANTDQPKADDTKPREMAVKARNASRVLQNLSSKQREQLLHKIADNLEAKEEEIMAENDKDCQVDSWHIPTTQQQNSVLHC